MDLKVAEATKRSVRNRSSSQRARANQALRAVSRVAWGMGEKTRNRWYWRSGLISGALEII